MKQYVCDDCATEVTRNSSGFFPVLLSVCPPGNPLRHSDYHFCNLSCMHSWMNRKGFGSQTTVGDTEDAGT